MPTIPRLQMSRRQHRNQKAPHAPYQSPQFEIVAREPECPGGEATFDRFLRQTAGAGPALRHLPKRTAKPER